MTDRYAALVAEIRQRARADAAYSTPKPGSVEQHREDLLAAYDDLNERLRPMATAHEACLRSTSEREYYRGRCEDCSCCSPSQCSEDTCPTNAVGESICPCTCD